MFLEKTSQRRILVADADPAAGELLAPAFSARGWTLESVQTPAESLARVAAEPFDAVVLAFDGDWLERIRSLCPGARAILIPSDSAPERVIAAIRARAFSYFNKPFSPVAVAEMIALALASSSWEDDIEPVSCRSDWLTFRVRCKFDTADRVVQFVRELTADLSPGKREDVAAAVRELLLNAIEHGAHGDPRKRVVLSLLRTARAVLCHIRDPGPGFSFDAISHAAVANPPGEPVRHVEIRAEHGFRPGGFGILLTRNLVDELHYNEKGNEVLFIKYR